MDISPKLLRDVEFREQRKGYSPDQVDDFLERLAVGVGQLQEQLKEATARAEEAERRRGEGGADEEGITRTLVLAQRTADAALLEARQGAAATTAEAQERAATLVAEAQEQAASLVSSAEERAAASDRAAAERAASVVSEAETRVANELAPLLAQRDALQQDVEALRAWASEIRVRMADELRQQLAWLDGDGADLPAAPAVLEMELPEGAGAPADEHQGDGAVDDEHPSDAAQGAGGPQPGSDDGAAPEQDRNGSGGPPPIGVLDAEHRARVDQGDHGVEGGPLATAAADDPFLAELRLAVTDDEPLGPRDPVTADFDHGDDDDSSSLFRRKKRH